MDIQISDINIYRDGGSIEFSLKADKKKTHVRLDTPSNGVPRELRLNFKSVGVGNPALTELLASIELWFTGLPPDIQALTLQALAHKGAFVNPEKWMLQAIECNHVLRVRDYIRAKYLG